MLVLFLFFLEIQDGLSVSNPNAWRFTLGGGNGKARRNIQIFHNISVENRRGTRHCDCHHSVWLAKYRLVNIKGKARLPGGSQSGCHPPHERSPPDGLSRKRDASFLLYSPSWLFACCSH